MMLRNILSAPIGSALSIMLLVSACSDTTLATRSFNESLQALNIPGSPIALAGTLPPIDVPLNLRDQEDFSSLDFVTSVNIRNITFNIIPESENPNSDPFEDGNPDNFDFISGLSLSMVATINGTSQVVPVASLAPGSAQIGTNTRTLELDVEDTDIRDFVEAPDVALRVSVAGMTPLDFVTVIPEIRYRVGIGIR